ncbi:hypothetical protein JYU15_02240, partial [bacterium AH-315-I18]|nr:hypothetical protein [bacterium AH-315-I18]
MNNPNTEDRLNQATSTRLAELANRPVDTSRLAKQLEQVMRDETEHEPAVLKMPQRFWRPTSAAAVILIAVMIGWMVIQGSSTPAIAAPAGLAQIYHDVTNELSPHAKVSSIQEANRVLAAQASGAMLVPDLPG